MSYNLEFDRRALKEWQKLAEPIKRQLKKKLLERLENPHIQSDRLHGSQHMLYKIKLRSAGYRLIYQVIDEKITVLVLSVGKREHLTAYEKAFERLSN